MNIQIQRKYRLIELIMGIQQDALLENIEQHIYAISPTTLPKPNFLEAVIPTRKNVSLDTILQEQDYQSINYEKFSAEAQSLDIEEPLEELLQLLKN